MNKIPTLLLTCIGLLICLQKPYAQCPNSATFTLSDLGGGKFLAVNNTSVPSGFPIIEWVFGDGASQTGDSIMHQYSHNGTYYLNLFVYDSLDAGWCASILGVPVTVINSICNVQPSFTTNTIPGTNTVEFTNTTTDSSMGSSAIVSVFWSFGDNQDSYELNPTHPYAMNGAYQVCVTVINDLNCTDTFCQNVTVTNGCDFIPSVNLIDMGNWQYLATYTVAGTYIPGTSYWYTSNGQTSDQPSTSFNFPIAGSYNVCLTLTDTSGCSAIACDSVYTLPCSLVANYTYSIGNGVNNIILEATPLNGTGPYQLSWNYSDGTTLQTTDLTHIHHFNTPGIYQVCVWITDANNCTSQYCNSVTVPGDCSNFIASCTNQEVSGTTYIYTAQASGGVAPYSYSWTFPSGTPYNSATAITTVTYADTGTYEGIVVVTDAQGCIANCTTSATSQPSDCNIELSTFNWQGIAYVSPFNVVGNPSQMTINWGDGSSIETFSLPITGSIPTHQYPSSGYYSLCVWINTGTCTDTTCQSFYACIDTASFTYYNNGNNNYTFEIDNYNPTIQYTWYIGSSGIPAINSSLNYDFVFQGIQSVCLIQQGACADSICHTINISVQNADTISGHFWNDLNGNGLWDNGETALTNGYVYLCAASNPQNCQWQYVDANGFYQFIVAAGSYTLTASYWAQNTVQTYPYNPTTYTFTTTGGQNITGFNFGYQNQSVIICGVVYNDANGNGLQDSGESGVPNTYVKINGYWYYTNSNGQYYATLTPGTYNIIYNNAPNGYTVTQPTGANPYVVNASQIGQTYCNNNFGIYADPSLQNLCVDIIPYTTVTPGFPAWYYIKYCNYGAFAMSGTVTFHWDAGLIATGSGDFSVSPTTLDIANNTATWDFSNLQPGECSYIYVDLTASTTLVLGTNTVEFAKIDPITGDAYPLNNVDTAHQVVVGSWDPNAKEVSPGVGPEGYVHPNTKLNYTIHFQNMGTAPAVNVIVIDTLSNLLDWDSFRMVCASHNYTVEFDQTNGIAVWYFNNIMLPDSGADYQGSMGFLQFSINQNPNLEQGSVITNLADIYFDFNTPVRTNTAKNTINKYLSIEPALTTPFVAVFPNPVHDAALFLNQNTNAGTLRLVIRNVVGQIVANATIEKTGSYQFNRNNLPSGVYMYEVISSDGKTANGKIILD